MKIYYFPPISNQNSKILILGTMPGEKSLRLGQYYGHSGNTFWKLVFSIFNQSFSNDYEKRKNILLQNNIALWDVLKACERKGSSDCSILKEEANNFQSFFENNPHIELISFNGQNAQTYFDTFCKIKPAVKYITLPSTSPANTWKTFEEKLKEWQVIKF